MEDFIEAYRPDKFKDVLGNQHIKNQVKTWLSKGFRPRSILLTGDYGTGKTTLAKLISKRFICFSAVIESIEACGNCDACKYETSYFQGIDMTNTSVEEVRYRLRRHAANLFTQTPVFYFDELQRWTKKNQETLLKPIEEMVNLMFVFSTTDLVAIEKGILSRSTILYVEPPAGKELSERLRIMTAENNIAITDGAIDKIIKLSRRIPRACIKAMNILIGMDGEITEDALDDETIRKAIAWETGI